MNLLGKRSFLASFRLVAADCLTPNAWRINVKSGFKAKQTNANIHNSSGFILKISKGLSGHVDRSHSSTLRNR